MCVCVFVADGTREPAAEDGQPETDGTDNVVAGQTTRWTQRSCSFPGLSDHILE